MPLDYIGTYFTENGFDLPSLIDDDFLASIRLMYDKQYYVSAAKLLMSFIDSIGYVEFGDDERNPFVSWLAKY